MARVAITEYAAKRLVLGETYVGVSATKNYITDAVTGLSEAETFVVKVDVGLKKRGKQGLIEINVPKSEVAEAAQKMFADGYERVLIEPFIAHAGEEERYLSISLTREGCQVLHSNKGGVDIEAHHDSIESHLVPLRETLAASPTLSISIVPLVDLLAAMQTHHLSFLEINPYLAVNKGFIALDMAVEIDSANEPKLPDWVREHILHKKATTAAEAAVLEQDARTPAALNLHTLNQNGSILTLFSGGGASLVALDSLVETGLSNEVINYSEYSGAPTRDETALYVSTLLDVLFDSTAKNKVILIAGGVANFTDVRLTFQGIVDAFSKNIEKLKSQQVYVCVRRGGPSQEAGLAHLREFLQNNAIPHDVHGPSLSLGEVGNLVTKHL